MSDRETLYKNMDAIEHIATFNKADLVTLKAPVQNEMKSFSQANIDEYEKTRVMALDRISRLYYSTLKASDDIFEYMKSKKA